MYIPPFVVGLIAGICVTFIGFAVWGTWLSKKSV